MKATLRRLASVQDAAAACEGCQPLSSIHNTLFHQAVSLYDKKPCTIVLHTGIKNKSCWHRISHSLATRAHGQQVQNVNFLPECTAHLMTSVLDCPQTTVIKPEKHTFSPTRARVAAVCILLLTQLATRSYFTSSTHRVWRHVYRIFSNNSTDLQ